MTQAPVQPPAEPSVPTARPLQLLRNVAVQTVVGPVSEGRIRETGWPYGLRAVVLLAYLAFAAAAVLVVASSAVRAHAVLDFTVSQTIGVPETAIWMLATLFSFGLSLLLAAGLHAPWWLRVLALLVVLSALAAWALRTPSTSGSPWWPVLVLLLLAGLVVLVVVRSRRSFAWWEQGAVWAICAACLVIGLEENHYSLEFGTDQSPLLLQYVASVLGYLVLPTAMVAGASVAEVCVRLTVAATGQAQRLTHRWVPYAVLGVVAAVRAAQVVRQLVHRDPVSQGWDVVLPSIVLVGVLGGVGIAVLSVARRRSARPDVDRLGDELSAVALPVGAALIVIQLPTHLAIGIVPVLAALDTTGVITGSDVDFGAISNGLTGVIRAVVGLAVLVLAFRAARRGRATRALVLATVGVLLVGLARTLLQGPQTRAGVDPDMLNLVATAVVVVGGVTQLVRRRLDRPRAIALAGALTLCALFSSRDFISDPVGALLGFSGAALVLFGLTWDLFTGSSWANGESRRFARPTRVLLVLANSVTTMSVLAYAALVRDGSTTIYLDAYAEFGDLVFGTALLAAAVVAVLAPGSDELGTAAPVVPGRAKHSSSGAAT